MERMDLMEHICEICKRKIPVGSGAIIRKDANGGKHYYHHKCLKGK